MSAIQQLMASFKKLSYTEYAFFNTFGFVSGHNPGNFSATALSPIGSPSSAIGRVNLGKSSGKWYWEVQTGQACNGNYIGIATFTFPMNIYLGHVAESVGWTSAGILYDRGPGSGYGVALPDYAVVGVALDMDAGTLTFYVNNIFQGVAVSGLTGTWYPAALAGSSTPAGSITLNTGPTTAYSPPAGHSLMSTYYP